ncbi:MAG: glycosyltransferase [Acidimicrobiia bacterium]|nr:glycosyltransferase [Acidimicrobiia bacterium]
MQSRRRRIIHVMPLLDPDYGGPTEATLRLCQALHDQGVEVEVLSTDRRFLGPGPFHIDADEWSFPITQFATTTPIGWSRSPDLAASMRERAGEVDLVHVHTIFHHTTVVAARAALAAGTPLVMEPHGSLTSYSRRQKLWKKRLYGQVVDHPLLRRADGVRCASSREKDDLAELGLASAAFVVPHGVEVPEPRPGPRSGADGGPVVLFLGRLAAKKRLDLTLTAFRHTLERVPSARLRIVGSGDAASESALHTMRDDLGIEASVDLVGPRFGDDRARELERADAFVLLSDDESFGMAAAEAVCAGLPVVATRGVASMVDLAPRAEVRLVGQDPVEAGAALADVLLDPEAATRARAAAPRVVEVLSWSSIATSMQAEYDRLIDR